MTEEQVAALMIFVAFATAAPAPSVPMWLYRRHVWDRGRRAGLGVGTCPYDGGAAELWQAGRVDGLADRKPRGL